MNFCIRNGQNFQKSVSFRRNQNKVSRNLSVGKMAFEEKKKVFEKRKIVFSYSSPKIPQDLHTYFEWPWSAKCPSNFKVSQIGPDQMLLKSEKSTFTTVICQVLEKKSYLASEIFKLLKNGWVFLKMVSKFKCRRVWRI